MPLTSPPPVPSLPILSPIYGHVTTTGLLVSRRKSNSNY